MTPRSQAPNNYGFARGERIADLMTAEHAQLARRSEAAERAGNAATAVELHSQVPMFRRSAHRVVLEQLASLSGEMTPWMWARWAAYQCTRAEDGDAGQRLKGALQRVVDTFYLERLEVARQQGQDWVPFVAHLAGQSWLFHQWCTYEAGLLAAFLDDLATGDLRARSSLAWSWVDAGMGGFRMVSAGVDGLVVQDLSTGDDVRLLDLGAGFHAEAGGWLIGRVVPSGTEPALMFDSRPVAVDEQTAREVAQAPSGRWLEVLRRAVEGGRIDLDVFVSEDRELVTDIPSLMLVVFATQPQALSATLDQLARGRDEVGRAAYKVLRQVAEGRLGPDDLAPFVAAAVLQPHGHVMAQRGLLVDSDPEVWLHWAGLVPEPARGRLLGLAEGAGRTGP